MNLPTSGRRAGGVRRWPKPACAAFLALYFFYFAADTVTVHFAPDDMMNMALYYREPLRRVLLSLFMPWNGFYRPLAALYYLPLHHFFGLNPVPYHIVMTLLLLAGIGLVYKLGVLLGAGSLASLLAVFILCYHAGVANLYYNTAFIYDVLCGLFYIAALVYYIRIRESGRPLAGREMACFLMLHLLALDAKEMAVTLPVMLLIYEALYRRPWDGSPTGPAWPKARAFSLQSPGGRVLAASVLLDAVYCYGKTMGANALMSDPAYRPVFSLARFEAFQIRSLNDMLLSWGSIRMRAVILVWFALFYLALRLKRPVLWFCGLFAALTPVPIEFLEGRGGACLYLPLIGWSIFAAAIFCELVTAATRLLADDPVLRHLGTQAIAALLIACGMFVWARENRHLKTSFVRNSMAELGAPTWAVIRQFAELRPAVRRHSRVVLRNDPFEGYDAEFIAELWFRDPTVEIRLDRKTPFTTEELAQVDYVFAFEGGQLVRER